jgi:hypothetical protein
MDAAQREAERRFALYQQLSTLNLATAPAAPEGGTSSKGNPAD